MTSFLLMTSISKKAQQEIKDLNQIFCIYYSVLF